MPGPSWFTRSRGDAVIGLAARRNDREPGNRRVQHGQVKTTRYFDFVVLGRRPYLKLEWVEQVLRAPEHREVQGDGRIRHWGYIGDMKRYLRVVTLPDGETVHNAFPDRRFEVPDA